MLVACLLVSLVYASGKCQNLFVPQCKEDHTKLIKCVIGILEKYFTEYNGLTYVDMNPHSDEILKAIHSTKKFSILTRQSTQQMFAPNLGYLISSDDVTDFTEYFEYLIREPTWNPYARFLIIIRSLDGVDLTVIFNELLKRHVNNVVVVNGTDQAHLYTYNPFDNYACGRYYETIISYGLCSQATMNLYPNKLVTGLRRCNFTASLAHRPPLTVNPLKAEDKKTVLGTEEYIMTLLGKVEQFTVSFNYSYNGELFSTVAPNMTAFGPMEMLQKNQCDVIFGGMVMVTSRAEAFTYLCGYHDYSDELIFAVKRSSLVPVWKYIYLEFELDVWAVLLVGLVVYSIIVAVLLRTKDVGDIVLRLLDNLLQHGRDIRTRFSVKCVLITWVWFSYLINTFYQSNLFSLTTQPSLDFQVSDEDDIIKYNFEPCFTPGLRNYLLTEATKLSKTGNFRNDGCQTHSEAMDTISKTENMFTLIPNYFYLYNERKYKDKWGESLIYYFEKPYTKFLFGFFFYKGFPITKSLQLNALRMRENGLADKSLHDHYFARRLKQKFSQKKFQIRFLFPLRICIIGLIISTVTFIIELFAKHLKRFKCEIRNV